MEQILRVDNLTGGYANKNVLHDISFDVKKRRLLD